jgi:hypothetical protein
MKLFTVVIYNFSNQLECVSLVGFLIFFILIKNIRLGWKGLPGTNTSAYFEKLFIMALKSFIALVPA